MTETELQRYVLRLAADRDWWAMHVRLGKASRPITPTSVRGWPDLTLWRPGSGLLFRELKGPDGKLKPHQADVLASLEAAGQDVDVWTPADMATIEHELR